jgi:hypothetical protein
VAKGDSAADTVLALLRTHDDEERDDLNTLRSVTEAPSFESPHPADGRTPVTLPSQTAELPSVPDNLDPRPRDRADRPSGKAR